MQQSSKGPAKTQLWNRPEYTQCIPQFFHSSPCPVNAILLSHVTDVLPSQPSTAMQHQHTQAPGKLVFKAILGAHPPQLLGTIAFLQLLDLAQDVNSWGETAGLSTYDSKAEKKHNAVLGMRSFELE